MDKIEETRRQVKRFEASLLWLAVIFTVLLIAAGAAGYNLSPLYFLGALAALPPGGALIWTSIRLKRLKTLLRLRERWAGKVKKDRDYSAIASLHEHLDKDTDPANIVDGQTWHDLDLNQVYALLDRTLTAEGQAVLYHMLKSPCYTLEPLQERAAMIKVFQEDAAFREELQLVLLPLEGRSDKDSTDLLWGQLPTPSPLAPLYHLLALAALLSLASPLLLGVQGIVVIMAVFGLNIFVHHRVSRKISHMLPGVSSLAALLRTAMKIACLERRPEMQQRQNRLQKAAIACRPILKKIRFLHPKLFVSDLDLLYEYVKYFFLLEVRSFYSALSEIRKHSERLREIYLIIGELDALQSTASYRESLPGYVEPELFAGISASCAVTDVRHPLLDDAVANSITMDGQGVLITGSNMSGKSTFLRTMGVNALLAQTLYTCTATSYRGGFFRVITSISLEDSLSEGKSYYYREAERLLKLIDAAEADAVTPALCIVDELLSGTNYTERLAASEAILNHLARQNALVIVATHDLDLAEKLQELYRCCHFTDQVGVDGLHFDFKLKDGIASTRNAIKLLSYLGYPRNIVEQADLKAGQYGNKEG